MNNNIKVYLEIPNNCFECPFISDNLEGHDGCFCLFLDKPAKTNNRLKHCPLIDIKVHDKEFEKEIINKIIKFINELAWKDVQYDAYQSTMGEFTGSTSAIPRYAKKYFNLWKDMFNEDLNKLQDEEEEKDETKHR